MRSKRTHDTFGCRCSFAHYERHGGHKSTKGQLSNAAFTVARTASSHPYVLLMDPTVHQPHVHELAIRHRAGRARYQFLEALWCERAQLGETPVGDVDELSQDVPTG